jgi:hypothetical protein
MSLSDLPRGYDAYVTRGPAEPKPEREPDDDDGLTGPICETCNGRGYVYSDPDHKLLTCGDCEGRGTQ